MPRGGGGGGGRGRGRKSGPKRGTGKHFTSPEELEAQQKAEWRGKARDSDEDEDSDEEDSDEEEDPFARKKGVEGLISIENPNRVSEKTKKASQINLEEGSSQKATLSRREREQMEKEQAKQHYQKLHAAGKTDEARADLARLAIIRKQREDAAKKRDEEKNAKAAAAAAALKK